MFIKSELIATRHGFFSRQGGESQGEYSSLNCGFGSGDTEQVVKNNRGIISKALRCGEIVSAKQTHSDVALVINEPGVYTADALVTDKFGLPIGILTADCAPVLLYSAKAAVVAAVHAGWRGARFGIIGSTIRTMQNLGANDIFAVIGPCINHLSYEVGQDFFDVFLSESTPNYQFFTGAKKPGHFLFDLPGYVEMKLYKNGVSNVEIIKEDTYSQESKYFSYRRSSQKGVKEYGRQLSVICL